MTTHTKSAEDTDLQPAGAQSTALVALPAIKPDETNLRYMTRLMEMLPPQTEDVIDRIAGQILGAATQYEENLIWDATGSKEAIGKRFVFHSVHLQPSDYDEALLPYFLVCKVTDLDTGEQTVLTTGSTNIMASLIKAQILGQLPWEGEIAGPRRMPKSGHMPLHMRWIAQVVTPSEEG
jgi:hypothetical protein